MQNLDLFASKFDLGDEPELTLTLPNVGRSSFTIALAMIIAVKHED